MSYCGRYVLKNPGKYMGKGTTSIIYKSRNELVVFNGLDIEDKVIRWGYEIIRIPYFCRIDHKIHRYEVDIYCEIKNGDTISRHIIEIKSSTDLLKPKQPTAHSIKSKTKYRYDMYTWIKNTDKWNAARQFCKQAGIRFIFLTEKDIFKQRR